VNALFLCLRWLKSDVMKRRLILSEKKKSPPVSTKRPSGTTLDACFAKFTQQEEVIAIIAVISTMINHIFMHPEADGCPLNLPRGTSKRKE